MSPKKYKGLEYHKCCKLSYHTENNVGFNNKFDCFAFVTKKDDCFIQHSTGHHFWFSGSQEFVCSDMIIC